MEKTEEFVRLRKREGELRERYEGFVFDGTLEVKERRGRRYLYVRRRVEGKLTSVYVDVFSEERYRELVGELAEAREVRRELRAVERELERLRACGAHAPFLGYGLLDTVIPMTEGDPDAVLETFDDPAMRRQYEMEICYLRGDYLPVAEHFAQVAEEDSTKLCAALISMIAAVNTNNYDVYLRIREFLLGCMDTKEPDTVFLAECALGIVSASMYAPKLLPEWLQEGDFSRVPDAAMPSVMYLYTKYMITIQNYERAYGVATATIALLKKDGVFTHLDIYMMLMCSNVCHCMQRPQESQRWLERAMDLALPCGFITPFAELVTAVDESLEQLLLKKYPQYYDAIYGTCEQITKNWLRFHNRYTQEHITLLLNRREYQIATLLAHDVSYEEIGRRMHLASGTVRNYASDIYGKLYVKNRKELSRLLL